MTLDDVKVAHHFAQLGDFRIHYVTAGEGPTVLLLHGFPETWWSWRHQLAPLAAAGYRVIAPDLRGYGDSDQHGPYGLETTTGDVVKLIESLGLGPRAHLIGHDWGGAVAWHLAATRPDRCETLTVLNCPHPTVIGQALISRPKARQLLRSWYMFFFQIPQLPEWLLTRGDAGALIQMLRGNAVDKTNFAAEELRPLRDALLRPGAATAMVGWYRAALGDAIKRRGKAPKYDPVTVPAMLIWGMADTALGFDDLVPGTRALVPGLRVEPIDACGHFVHAEQPGRVNALLLDFLGRATAHRAA